MIGDANGLVTGFPVASRICIIGAGAAGITLACELDGSGIDVIVLDSGNRRGSDPYEGLADSPHPPPAQFRRLGFGGTTGLWGGRCVPYDPIDFEQRRHVPESGWPIAYADVAAYYPAALSYCHAGKFDFTASGSLSDASPMLPGVHHSSLELDRIERYSLPTDFGKRHGKRLAQSRNVRVIRNAHVVRLSRSSIGETIEGVDFVDDAGRTRTCVADVYVLAMGGLETTRLLLSSNADGIGLGNRSGHLGRYYQCHIGGVLGVVRPRKPGAVFRFEKTIDGVYAKRKIQIADDVQRRAGLLNMAFRLHYPDVSDAAHGSSVLSAMFLVKQGLAAEYRRILQHGSSGSRAPVSGHLRNVARGLPAFLSFGFDWTRRRILAERKLPYVLVANRDGSFPLDFNSEQIPLHESHIELSRERDRYGMQRLAVHWRKSQDDVQMLYRSFLLLRGGIEASGQCTLEFETETLLDALAAAGPIGGHHIGTARMAAHAGAGVVDANGALFDFPNLYVASAAAFPTSSHANPTLTIVAMALRMAAHLRSEVGHVEQLVPA